MPVSDKATTPSSSFYSLDLDPLLSDLVEKKLSLRRSLAWLDAELKDARFKLSSKEQLLAQESENRKKFAESKARSMEEKVRELHKCLQDKDEQLRASASLCSTEQYLCFHKLDVLRSQLSFTQATEEASAASAMLAQLQCLSLSGEHEKNTLGECELQVKTVEEQLDLVQKHLEAKGLLQLEKHRMTGHELKKKVLKLECTLKNHDLNGENYRGYKYYACYNQYSVNSFHFQRTTDQRAGNVISKNI
ncbi:hypothetical protein E2562_015129 [Oryza meyeriana var. granulata]|uniref:Uncharacterized protein n=1 Tax=Oryza meyeriana var. granulata TaxID=110450 RepID=A0A6G1DWR5_9ORYZ|nr:hypothetical protein E2562_015129 [Oryza meyeriana var. granulata]